ENKPGCIRDRPFYQNPDDPRGEGPPPPSRPAPQRTAPAPPPRAPAAWLPPGQRDGAPPLTRRAPVAGSRPRILWRTKCADPRPPPWPSRDPSPDSRTAAHPAAPPAAHNFPPAL